MEATKQTQRLLDSVPFRAVAFGGHAYSTNVLGTSTRLALDAVPVPSEADQLYKDWLVFSRFLKDDERLNDGNSGRPLSHGATPAPASGNDEKTAAVLYHLRRELEDAIMVEENRVKRTALEKRTNLSPSDAVRQEMKGLPTVPLRTYTLDTDHSGSFSRFETDNPILSDSMATLRSDPCTPSPTGSPQIPQSYFAPIDWSAASPNASSLGARTSMSTISSSFSTSSDSRHSVGGLGINTAGTTPNDGGQSMPKKSSSASLLSIALGPGALQWNKLCRKVEVERSTLRGTECKECDLHFRYREDAGISIRAVYRANRGEVKVWIT